MSNILRKKLVIELKSDLISGSGEGWGNTVDNDIVYDQFGFPYIPAKRIKGLLKEAALDLEELEVLEDGISEDVFGNEEEQGHHFIIYNAFLEHIDDMKNEIVNLKKEYQKYVTISSVLNHYTIKRYQTALDDDGIAKENSLRLSRAISKNQKFYAKMEYEEQDDTIIKKCISMIHHMGVSRNRGFGEVDLYLEDDYINLREINFDMEDDLEYDVKLYLENKTELSISNFQKEKSLDYISGASLLGCFANLYLKTHQVDQRFYDLFVSGNVRFSNAYISDEVWDEYRPIRESLYQQKVGDYYIDKLVTDSNEILSKVRNKYISSNKIKEVEKEMYYHHRRPKDKSIGHVVSNERIEDGTFYQLEVISANQRFIAHINGKGKDLKEILMGLPSFIRIGKSKYTQYGNVYIDHITYNICKSKIIEAGKEVVCTLLSPLLILDEKKESRLDTQELNNFLNLENPRYFVGFSKVGGYNAKWKLQKPSYIAFSAGSCIKGILKNDIKSEFVYGDLLQEGLGQIIVQDISEIKVDFKEYKAIGSNKNELNYTKEIVIDALKHELHLNALKQIKTITIDKLMTKTLIGRLLRMLENSTWDLFIKKTNDIVNKDKNRAVTYFIEDIKKICEELLEKSLLNKFINEDYIKEFYLQTCKDYLTHEKIERRNV